MNFKQKIINSGNIIYSFEAKRKIDALINQTTPDIAHLHIFQHQLTPSIIHSLKSHNIKIVNTIHDLKVICPNYMMLNKKGICEECKGKKYYKCYVNSCIKNSKAKSLIGTLEAYVNEYLKSYSYVDKFICPSKFYMEKLIDFGIPEKKVCYIPNFVDVPDSNKEYEIKNYILYMGRLSQEKGINFLIEAMKDLKHIELKVAGAGPLENELKEYVKENKIENVSFLGFKSHDELEKIIKECRFIVIPSEWYENCPMTVLESMAYGKCVLGSDMGGIPELIKDKKTGLIFKSQDKKDFIEKISYLYDNPLLAKDMGDEAKKCAKEEYNKELHLKKVKAVYDELLN